MISMETRITSKSWWPVAELASATGSQPSHPPLRQQCREPSATPRRLCKNSCWGFFSHSLRSFVRWLLGNTCGSSLAYAFYNIRNTRCVHLFIVHELYNGSYKPARVLSLASQSWCRFKSTSSAAETEDVVQTAPTPLSLKCWKLSLRSCEKYWQQSLAWISLYKNLFHPAGT